LRRSHFFTIIKEMTKREQLSLLPRIRGSKWHPADAQRIGGRSRQRA